MESKSTEIFDYEKTRTKKDKKINAIEDRAYSSVHSIISFVVSFAYIIVDVVCTKGFEKTKIQKDIASLMLAVLLLASVVISSIWICKLRKSAETDYKRMKKTVSFLNVTREVSDMQAISCLQ